MTTSRTTRSRPTAPAWWPTLAALALVVSLAACGPDGTASAPTDPPGPETPAPEDPAPEDPAPDAPDPDEPAPDGGDPPPPSTASVLPVDVCVATTPVSEPDARTCARQEVAFTVPARP